MNKKLLGMVIGLIVGSLQCANQPSMAFRSGTPPLIFTPREHRRYDHTQKVLGNSNWCKDLQESESALLRDKGQMRAFPQMHHLEKAYNKNLRNFAIKLFADCAYVGTFTEKLENDRFPDVPIEQLEDIAQRYLIMINEYQGLINRLSLVQEFQRIAIDKVGDLNGIINKEEDLLNQFIHWSSLKLKQGKQ